MTPQPPNEFENEPDLCSSCTLDSCTSCPNQSEIDRLLGFDEVAIFNHHIYEGRKRLPPEYQPVIEGDEDDDECLLPPAPRPFQSHPPKVIDEKLKEKKPASANPSAPAEKKRPGAPKGNLNALKHGIYISGSSVRNTTPMERAKLGDLHALIDHVKTYIEKVYENGLTLKTTEEMNDTLKRITSASIALTRLLHTQDALMYSGLPMSLGGETRAKTVKLLSYYQKQQNLYQELTEPEPEPDLDTSSESLSEQNQK